MIQMPLSLVMIITNCTTPQLNLKTTLSLLGCAGELLDLTHASTFPVQHICASNHGQLRNQVALHTCMQLGKDNPVTN